jgi:hypothetical protein
MGAKHLHVVAIDLHLVHMTVPGIHHIHAGLLADLVFENHELGCSNLAEECCNRCAERRARVWCS